MKKEEMITSDCYSLVDQTIFDVNRTLAKFEKDLKASMGVKDGWTGIQYHVYKALVGVIRTEITSSLNQL